MTSLAVPRPLLRVMATAGVTAPGDVDRLSEEQLARILENKTPSERMEIKSTVMAAGIYPRDLRTFSAIPIPR